MNGIKMSDCKFYVDEENRTVVCVIPKVAGDTNVANSVLDFIYENCDFGNMYLYDALSWKGRDKLTMPRTFIGKAVCAPEDEWDEETGKLIAFSRAKQKFYTSFFKRANIFVNMLNDYLEDSIEKFNDFGMQVQNNADVLEMKINDRLETEEENEEE